LVIDPAALAGNDAHDDRVEALCSALLQEPDVRLPGACREHLAHRAVRNGRKVSEVLMQI
jgi:(2R)-3-sulfolactate dehydrogenase (NADP+)